MTFASKGDKNNFIDFLVIFYDIVLLIRRYIKKNAYLMYL